MLLSFKNNDPAPWVDLLGNRVGDPTANNAPVGAYIYSPREGYTDYQDQSLIARKEDAR